MSEVPLYIQRERSSAPCHHQFHRYQRGELRTGVIHFHVNALCTILQYRGTSLIRNHPTLGPYSGPLPRAM